MLRMTRLRIAAALGIHVANQEPTNILHYASGQEYRPYYDFIREDEEKAFASELVRVGQRVATFLIYLNDDDGGGETAFPHLNWRHKGMAGDVLLFWNFSGAGCTRARLAACRIAGGKRRQMVVFAVGALKAASAAVIVAPRTTK